MNFHRYISLIMMAVAVSFSVTAQLSDIKVVSVELAGENTDPGFDLNNKQMARIEITANGGVDGLKVVNNGYIQPAAKQSDGTYIYADAMAADNFKAQYLTLYHPDCKPLNLEFGDYEATQDLDATKRYRVSLYMPSAALVAANKAFDNLDLDEALRLFDKVTEPGEREIVASRKSLISEIRPTVEAAFKLEKSSVKTDRAKSLMLFENLARRTNSTEAKLHSRRLRTELVPGREDDEHQGGISKMKVSRLAPDVNNFTFKTRKKGKMESLSKEERENLALVTGAIPLAGIKFDAGDDLVLQEYDEGVYYVVLRAGETYGGTPLKISHPMFSDVVIDFGKGSVPSLTKQSQYVLELSIPPTQIVEGDMYFNGMDFNLASKVYGSVDRSVLDAEQLSLLNQRLDACCTLLPYSDAYFKLRDVINSPGEMVDRKAMISGIDLALKCLSEMEKEGVGSAGQLSRHYRSLRSDYTDQIHLSIRVDKEEKTDKGIKMAPLRRRVLYVSLKDGNNDAIVLKARPVPADAGRYSVFLPSVWSKKLMAGKSIKLKMSDSDTLKGDNVSDELTLTPKTEGGAMAMNYSVSLIMKK